MPSARYRLIGSLFNYLTMALVVAGGVGYLARWQGLEQAQGWLIAALITLSMAAICFRVARIQETTGRNGTTPISTTLEPLWPYYFVALCIILAALDTFTSLLNSLVIQMVIAGVVVSVIVKIFYHERQWRRRTGRRWNTRQRFALSIGMILFIVAAYRFVNEIFSHVITTSR